MPAPASLSNSSQTYGGVTKTFHWLTALLILSAFPLGMIAHDYPYDTSAQLAVKATLFSAHKTIGVTVFFVALARILWAITQPKPGLLHPDRKAEAFAAEAVHWALYISLVIVPLSGWLHHAATEGFAPIWWPFGQNLPMVPKSAAVAAFFGGWHAVFTKVLGVSVLLHIAGAMKHHVIDKDATLRRMLPGTPDLAPLPAQHTSRAPLVAALAIWAMALIGGSALGMMGGNHDAPAPAVATLDATTSDWQVQDGTLGISVLQMGSNVAGSFANWTADIAFDPEAPDDIMGKVTVDIAVGSLTLGSVTGQALGAGFLEAETHPTATFTADILRAGTAYVAKGTLSLVGQDVPVSLPFTLTLDGDTATMQGETTLNRQDFGIGMASYGDESSLGFPVAITVSLTALRTQ